MNGRKLFREYAQTLGKEAKEFVKIIDEQYGYDTLVTRDNNGKSEHCSVNYKEMINWIINNKKIKEDEK